MSKEDLENELEELELIGKLEDMNIREPEKEEEAGKGEEAEGIDDLIERIDKVHIEKDD